MKKYKLKKQFHKRFITKIEKIEDSIGICLKTSSPDECFLTKEYLVTHNTSFALKAAYEPAKNGTPTAFFSLEMSEPQLVSRLLSMEYKIEGKKFNTVGLDDSEVARMKEDMMEDLPLHIDDSSGLTIDQFTIKAKRLKNKYDIQR